MRLWLLAVLGLGVLADVCRVQGRSARSVLPTITNQTFINACVREHNKHRTAVRPAAANMLYMTWDAALARTARAWAKKCLFKHSPYLTKKFMSHPHYGHVGENIWTGHYRIFGVPEAIKLWTDEVQHYNLQTHKCTKTCGHYTQVVWDNSHKVGCAVVFCRKAAGVRDAAHFICNYVPRTAITQENLIKQEHHVVSAQKRTPVWTIYVRAKKRHFCFLGLLAPSVNPSAEEDHSGKGLSAPLSIISAMVLKPLRRRYGLFSFLGSSVISLDSRAITDRPRKSWDSALAKSAKAWAKRCHFDHNVYLKVHGKVHPNFTPVGENIWTGSLSLFSVSAAISTWYNEVTAYTFETRHCTRICGHYTQVVWATSYKVGCAVQFCPSVTGFKGLTNGAHFVCNYGPAGNYPIQPYKTGAACSDCNGEKCVDKLCENPEREKLKSYSSWYPDWDTPPRPKPSGAPRPNPSGAPRPNPPRSSCDQYCITVLIVRLLFVLLTFGAVLVVQWQYPQIFIYE
ncbi:unnamed protein product [Eretmochelys imbricata]